jgi:ribosome recycling factor
MSDEVKMALDEATEAMQKTIDHLEFELSKIRAGKANPAMLDGVKLDYYGSPTLMKNIANVSTPDPRTITVQPGKNICSTPFQRPSSRQTSG